MWTKGPRYHRIERNFTALGEHLAADLVEWFEVNDWQAAAFSYDQQRLAAVRRGSSTRAFGSTESRGLRSSIGKCGMSIVCSSSRFTQTQPTESRPWNSQLLMVGSV